MICNMSNYFTVLGYDASSRSYTHFSDFSVFSNAEMYANHLAMVLKPSYINGNPFSWYEIWDSSKRKVEVISSSGEKVIYSEQENSKWLEQNS